MSLISEQPVCLMSFTLGSDGARRGRGQRACAGRKIQEIQQQFVKQTNKTTLTVNVFHSHLWSAVWWRLSDCTSTLALASPSSFCGSTSYAAEHWSKLANTSSHITLPRPSSASNPGPGPGAWRVLRLPRGGEMMYTDVTSGTSCHVKHPPPPRTGAERSGRPLVAWASPSAEYRSVLHGTEWAKKTPKQPGIIVVSAFILYRSRNRIYNV